jgi:hypothetical protein
MTTKRKQAKIAASKKARERRKKNIKAAAVKKKADARKAIKEVREKMAKSQRKQPRPSFAKRIMARMVRPLGDKMTDEQVKDEFIKIAEGRSTLSRRQRAQVEHAHELLVQKMFGLDKKNKIGKPVEVKE